MLGSRRNAPRVRFTLGALGIAQAVLVVAYVVGQIVLYGYAYWAAQPVLDANSFLAAFFLRWAALKPVALFFVLLADVLQVVGIPLLTLFLLAGPIASGLVGSVGLFVVLTVARASCNSASGTSGAVRACHDPRYCCVYAGAVPFCPPATGPCPLPAPQTPADLAPNPDYVWLQWLSLALGIVELLVVVLMLAIRAIRARKHANYELLVEDAQRRVFGGTLLEGAEDGSDLLTEQEAKAELAAAEAEPAVDSATISARIAYVHAQRHAAVGAVGALIAGHVPAVPHWARRAAAWADDAFDTLREHLEGGLPQEAVMVAFADPRGKRAPVHVPMPVTAFEPGLHRAGALVRRAEAAERAERATERAAERAADPPRTPSVPGGYSAPSADVPYTYHAAPAHSSVAAHWTTRDRAPPHVQRETHAAAQAARAYRIRADRELDSDSSSSL